MPTAEVHELEQAKALQTTTLAGAYPNPFNPVATIRYTLAEELPVRLTVYDVLGRTVATLVDQVESAGAYEVVFDGSALPSGVYLYRLEAGALSQTSRLLLMK